MKPKILLVSCISAEHVRLFGFSPAADTPWFEAALPNFDIRTIRVADGEPLPPGHKVAEAAVIVGGSPLSVNDTPWITKLEDFMLQVHGRRPLLGMCFGHQALAKAFGGQVVPNPLGPEFGVSQVELTPRGQRSPLFEGLEPSIRVFESHGEVVTRPPGTAILLGTNEMSSAQALAYGERTFSVQFHAELGAETLSQMAGVRRQRLTKAGFFHDGQRRHGEDAVDRLLVELRKPGRIDGRRVLRNFGGMALR